MGLIWCFLLLNKLPNDLQRSTAAGCGKVTPAPEHIFPVPLLKRRELLSEQAAGNALEAIDQFREFNVGREVDQQVHMIGFAIEFSEFNMKALTDAGEDIAQGLDVNAFEDSPPILRREDQMGMKLEDAVSS